MCGRNLMKRLLLAPICAGVLGLLASCTKAEEPTPARLVAVVADGMATYRMVTIEVGAKPEARLTALNFQPYTPEVESP